MQVRKQQLEPDMEQWTGSKLEKEYVKAVYCHPAYITYMQSTSCEMTDFVFRGAPKITADGDCSHEIKRHLLLGRKAMTHLDSILKSALEKTLESPLNSKVIQPVNPKGNQP